MVARSEKNAQPSQRPPAQAQRRARGRAAPSRAIRAEAAAKRKARRHEASKNDILESAARAFARLGYHQATMQQIAEEAGYTAASLYTYFNSKDAIFEALLARVLDEMHATFHRAPEGKNLQQRLEALLRSQYQVGQNHRTTLDFFVRFATGQETPPRRAAASHMANEAALSRAFEGWLEQNAEPGELGGVSHEEAAMILVGISHSLFKRWAREQQVDAATQAKRVVGYFLHGVRGGGK
ncbi:MAG: TetR/AcrR family transcriptional regulator [Myxococcales bacterium]|nr:TetR/AcrR family transcriptional regulator [Myxococcales bacterium]MCB9578344.1 TetR/AcrR family transcriptional regulator [Polyangiaceae bacterium]